MPLLIAFATFVSVTLAIYGAMSKAAADPMESRLGGLRYARPGREPLPDATASFGARVMKPLSKGMVKRVNALLPTTMSERLQGSITQAGLRISPGQFIVVVALLGGVLPILLVTMMISGGQSAKMVLLFWGVMVFGGIYLPRIWLLGRIKRRQKEVWRALPDAFDLITASVEAGLGVDAAFSRVIEKVHGPFAEELTRTMREVTMGRARRDAFLDMSDRIGLEELRSLVNAIVQAETMGISIGAVIRVQTGVMRTKRRQKAEEQAFKAPIKMVFPLVFCIFPAIMVVIGGPAIIQMMESL
jgi:tight adherence protein C